MQIQSRGRLRTLSLFILLAAICSAPAARAGTANGQITVTATVLNNCIVSAGTLAFGTYSASSGSPTNASTTLSITCTNNLGYTMVLDGGSTTHTVAARAMTDGSHNLNYGLYTTSGYTSLWGDGTNGTLTLAGTGNGLLQSVTVYGQIPAGQYVPANNYSDTISVAVNY